MKRAKQFTRSSRSALWYFLLVVVLPITTLVLGGLVFLWQQDLLLFTVIAWLLVSAIAYGGLIYWPELNERQLAQNSDTGLPEISDPDEAKELPERLNVQSYWTAQDKEIWERSCLAIEQQLELQPEWETLPDLALQQLALIAEQYHGKSKSAQYRFTVPELLLVVSVTSARYRQLVIDYVPYSDKLSVASASTIFEQKANINTGYIWFNRIRRTARLLNPASAIVGELRDLISDKLFLKASIALQSDLKRLLLQEVTQVAIDLYSGKLSASNAELASYQSIASREDRHREAEATGPIRVLLLGQTSVGKSSLINALCNELKAEVGVLPVTERLTVHTLQVENEAEVRVIDTPGIDGTDTMQALLVEAALDADLIVWLAKATQPARAPDKELYQALQTHYAAHPEKLQAPLILALTHIDQLSPKAEWQPPYDLSSEQPKARAISAAIKSAQSQIALPEHSLAIPVYLAEPSSFYNVDMLAAQIMLLSETTAANVQLNRRRMELASSSKNWRVHWTQAKKLGRVIGTSIVKGI